MASDVVEFDAVPFTVNDDAELEVEDNRLQQELNQLIAEQLEDFDLGEDKDEESNEGSVVDSVEPINKDDLASILAAGKLSVLENAIRGFADGEPQISDDAATDQNSLASFLEPSANHEVHCRENRLAQECTTYPSHLCSDSSPWPNAPEVTLHQAHPMHQPNASNATFPHQFGRDYSLIEEPPTEVHDSDTFSKHVPSPPSRPILTHPALNFTNIPPHVSQGTVGMFRYSSATDACLLQPSITTADTVVEDTLPSDNPATDNGHNRLELLYAARGQQLQELHAEIERVREEAAKERRIANHRLNLAEDERHSLCSKLASSDALVQELRTELNTQSATLTSLKQELAEKQRANDELTTELNALRSTNESLSTQLVELTTGNAVRLVEEREGRLTEALERRYAAASDTLQNELQSVRLKLQNTELELRETVRQLEATKADAVKARTEFHEATLRSNKQLEEAQQHCQKLASSALCSEVTSLRQKVSELETTKKISDDVNRILQAELHDLRQQVSIYENTMPLVQPENAFGDAELCQSNQSSPLQDLPRPHSTNHVVTFEELCPVSAIKRPASALERTSANRDRQRAEGDFSRFYEAYIPGELGRSRTPGEERTVPEPDTDHFRSLSRHGALTSTPAPNAILARLRTELNRCLAQYKAKRVQVTQLHEIVFTTRCRLHQAVENSKRLEKNASMLQERVVTLERDLSGLRDLNENPGPRESVLQGQLQRLKSDYAKLEEELQCTRTRLQSALGAEARALEAEKATAERLTASVAERDAAVERTRAVFEAHYAAMRRQMETNWAVEQESTARHTEEMLNRFRKEATDREAEIERLNKRCQEADHAMQQAVENALYEAMQEREAERIRFWREELPNQLKLARLNWDQEWHEKCSNAVREAVDAYRLQHSVDNSRRTFTNAVEANTQTLNSQRSVSTLTEAGSVDTKDVQTDLLSILQTSDVVLPKSDSSQSFSAQVLSDIFGDEQAACLRVQLLESPVLNLSWINEQLCRFFRELFRRFLEVLWNNLKLYVEELFNLHGLPLPKYPDDLPDIPASFRQSFKPALPSWLLEDPSIQEIDSLRYHVLGLILHLSSLSRTEVPRQSVDGSPSHFYYAALEKIKQNVMDYVHTCQNRAAQTLHAHVGRVHRRACRQFASSLRHALCDYESTRRASTTRSPVKISSRPNSPVPRPRTLRPASLSDSSSRHSQAITFELNCLLQLVDEVCTRTETRFPTSKQLRNDEPRVAPMDDLNRALEVHPTVPTGPSASRDKQSRVGEVSASKVSDQSQKLETIPSTRSSEVESHTSRELASTTAVSGILSANSPWIIRFDSDHVLHPAFHLSSLHPCEADHSCTSQPCSSMLHITRPITYHTAKTCSLRRSKIPTPICLPPRPTIPRSIHSSPGLLSRQRLR